MKSPNSSFARTAAGVPRPSCPQSLTSSRQSSRIGYAHRRHSVRTPERQLRVGGRSTIFSDTRLPAGGATLGSAGLRPQCDTGAKRRQTLMMLLRLYSKDEIVAGDVRGRRNPTHMVGAGQAVLGHERSDAAVVSIMGGTDVARPGEVTTQGAESDRRMAVDAVTRALIRSTGTAPNVLGDCLGGSRRSSTGSPRLANRTEDDRLTAAG